jgi:hypothetical protein
MIVLAVVGAAISFAIFNKVIRSFQKNLSIQDSF